MSVLEMVRASATVLPLTHSVASELEAMAEPQPKVLNLASSMTWVSGLTLIWRRMTSPHSGAPTRPVPTSEEDLSRVPTLRGCLWCSTTFSLYAMGKYLSHSMITRTESVRNGCDLGHRWICNEVVDDCHRATGAG